jgi:hypothetical protein
MDNQFSDSAEPQRENAYGFFALEARVERPRPSNRSQTTRRPEGGLSGTAAQAIAWE